MPMDQSGRIRYLDIDAPELARTWEEPPTPAEYLGPEAAERMSQLIRPGQYVRVVQDSHDRAAGLGVWGRQLGYVETLPRPFDNLLRIPYLGKLLPARDTGRTLLQEGLADIGYRHLSGRTDRAVSYDRARAAAQTAERGIWSEEGRQHHPGAGQAKTVAERSDDWYRRQTGEERPAETFWDKALTPAAIGLMTTGNTGIFRDLTRSGPGISQLYNLTVAYLGAKNYNTRATRTAPMDAYQPNVRNIRQDERDRLLREAREPERSQAR